MCCGTAQNSYRTLERMRLVLADGAVLDSGDPASRRAFAEGHRPLLEGLSAIRAEILADAALAERIRRKYRIKNTTGYGLNSFLDFEDPLDVLVHLLVGSEGTLGFVSEVTFRTVEDHAHRASALVLFPDVAGAVRAVQALSGGPVSAAELMDRASLRAVEEKPGMPPGLRALPAEAAALLVEVRAPDAAGLAERMAAATAAAGRGRHALAGGLHRRSRPSTRRSGTCGAGSSRRWGRPARSAPRWSSRTWPSPWPTWPRAWPGSRALLRAHGYAEGILFGHALDGNLHFVFTQDFGEPAEVERYRRFLDEVCELVVHRFDGSLKGEHGTGRNMAPYVEQEWGKRAHALMWRVKALLDPRRILNPGRGAERGSAGARQGPEAAAPGPPAGRPVHECGFCEPQAARRGPSRSRPGSASSSAGSWPGSRRRRTGRTAGRASPRAGDYLGEETCATDGLCATACPVGIDTGELVKAAPRRGAVAPGPAGSLGRWPATMPATGRRDPARAGRRLGRARGAGERGLGALSRGARAASGGRLPLWNAALPGPSPRPAFPVRIAGRGGPALVYLPSCVARGMGRPRRPRRPGRVRGRALRCSTRPGTRSASRERCPRSAAGSPSSRRASPKPPPGRRPSSRPRSSRRARAGACRSSATPAPAPTSMRQRLDPRLTTYEPAELIHRLLMDRLRFERREGTVAVHVTCSSAKMGVGERLRALAEACAEKVVAPPVGCCGFAGDRGFSHPELNASALRDLRAGLPADCRTGYSNSRTCQIGLSVHAGIPYQSIVHLVDRCTRPRD